jgi:PGF-CTERM protein
MKRIVLSSVLAFLLILVFSLPSMAQQTVNVTATTNATATAAVNTTTATANVTTTAAGVTSFLTPAENVTAPPVPGFEAVLAVIGLLCIALILKRKM